MSLRSSKLDRDNNNDGDKDGTWDELAETTFNMYFKSLFDARDEENENEYDRHEDNEAFNESLSSLVREITRNCSAVFLTWSKFPDLENGVKPEPGWYANYVYAMFPRMKSHLTKKCQG